MSNVKHQIECPNCHKRFMVEYFDGIETKQIQCGNENCKMTLPFSSYLIVQRTLVKPVTPVIGQLQIKSTGDIYQLYEGEYIVGRTGTAKEAGLKLAVSDRSMSRLHLKMKVVKTALNYFHSVENAENKKPTYINGRELQQGEVVYLNYGDTLKMGETYIEFNKPE